MRVITIHNQKGGTGKTLLASHLAHHLEEAGQRVVLVDFDTQANLSRLFSAHITSWPASALFRGSVAWPEPPMPGVTLVPGDPSGLASLASATRAEALKCFIGNVSSLEAFDSMIIDTPPTRMLLSEAAIMVADLVVVPCEPHETSVIGASHVIKDCMSIRQTLNPGLEFRVVINRISAVAPKQREFFIGMAKKFGRALVPCALVERDAFKRSDELGVPVWRFPRGLANAKASEEMVTVMSHLAPRRGSV